MKLSCRISEEVLQTFSAACAARGVKVSKGVELIVEAAMLHAKSADPFSMGFLEQPAGAARAETQKVLEVAEEMRAIVRDMAAINARHFWTAFPEPYRACLRDLEAERLAKALEASGGVVPPTEKPLKTSMEAKR